ncbi:MAG: ATP synthase F1 subunit delta [Phycisphaerae bacterium]|nr:ATP synthase F1 subunit delta [Phycisphaerae bacterium]|tara:strand:- start:348 stop:953 length:606 start_codon:yes stop_codon:yes gene_type:complete
MATHTDTLARIYARSLFELCEEAGGRDKAMEVADELEQVCELARSDSAFNEFLASPLLEVTARGDSLKAIFENKISDLLLRFLLVLNANDRLGHLEQIEAAMIQIVHEQWGRIEVDVTTAQAMDDTARETITAQLKSALGKDPVIHSHVNEDLIGGITLRIGDQLIDGSVATQLRRLETDLKKSGGHEIRLHPERFLGESV